MKSKVFIVFIFCLTLLCGSYFRLSRLSSFPPSLFSDEVDAGYQAVVLNQYGTDYFGNPHPIHFHSFSDWRTSLYIYSIAFFQKITANPELSVRLPSALFGIISLLVFYLILTNIFKKPFIPLIGMALMAVSPWHLHYSRTGFEVSGMIMVLLIGTYFLQKFLQSTKLYFLFLAVLFLFLSPYFYSTAKLFLILAAALVLILWRRQIFKLKLFSLVLVFLLATAISLPLLSDTIAGKSGFRFSYINIFTEPNLNKSIDYLRYEDIFTSHQGQLGVATPLSSKIYHNRIELILTKFISNYYSSFSENFLFQKGDANSRHGFGKHGLLYSVDFLLLILGLFFSFRRRPRPFSVFFLLLLILAPIPFALTRDSISPHATRLILMLPSLIYFIAIGFYHAIKIIHAYLPRFKYFSYILIITLYLFSFSRFWHYYTNHYAQDSARDWHAGMKEAVISALADPDYPSIYFSNSSEPFLPFFLYYSNYLPAKLPITDHISHLETVYFDGTTIDNNYFFGHISWPLLLTNSSQMTTSLFVVPASEFNEISKYFPNKIKIINQVKKQHVNQEEFILFTLIYE